MIFTWLTTFGQTHQETNQQGLELSDDGYPQICYMCRGQKMRFLWVMVIHPIIGINIIDVIDMGVS